jgi:hypothetical protein
MKIYIIFHYLSSINTCYIYWFNVDISSNLKEFKVYYFGFLYKFKGIKNKANRPTGLILALNEICTYRKLVKIIVMFNYRIIFWQRLYLFTYT